MYPPIEVDRQVGVLVDVTPDVFICIAALMLNVAVRPIATDAGTITAIIFLDCQAQSIPHSKVTEVGSPTFVPFPPSNFPAPYFP